MRRLLLIGVLLAGCQGGKDKGNRTPGAPGANSPPSAPPPSSDMPSMPPYPEADRGRMAVQSAAPGGTEPVQRSWTAEAGWCETPPMLQVKSEQVAVGGTLVLLALPADKITTYPVALVSQGLPTPPAAQVGVQVFSRFGSFAYQATEGTVDIYAFGRTVSGRFAVTLREINRNDRIRYAGAFREVPLVKLDPSLCAPAATGIAPHP